MAYLWGKCAATNLNQYAKAANENGRVYAADMEDLRQRLDELIEIGRNRSFPGWLNSKFFPAVGGLRGYIGGNTIDRLISIHILKDRKAVSI